jgi:lysozyme family protein
MALQFKDMQKGYAAMWSSSTQLADRVSSNSKAAQTITSEVALLHYRAASKTSGVPAGLIAALNYRESGGLFTRYLGNGDPLSRKSTNVPAGRGPFATWELGAADALAGIEKPADGRWTIEFALYIAEVYNGRGYIAHGENSPYVWAGTNYEQRGMFTTDHGFDASAFDARAGVAALFLAFQSVAPGLVLPSLTATMEPPVTDATTKPSIDPFPVIIEMLELSKKSLPLLVGFLPPPAGTIVQIAVPALEDLMTFIEQARTSGVAQPDVKAILEKIVTHLKDMSATLAKPAA